MKDVFPPMGSPPTDFGIFKACRRGSHLVGQVGCVEEMTTVDRIGEKSQEGFLEVRSRWIC